MFIFYPARFVKSCEKDNTLLHFLSSDVKKLKKKKKIAKHANTSGSNVKKEKDKNCGILKKERKSLVSD